MQFPYADYTAALGCQTEKSDRLQQLSRTNHDRGGITSMLEIEYFHTVIIYQQHI